jgi:hypothetical protein
MRSPRNSPPTYSLDTAILRVAVLRARELVQQGRSIDEAVVLACPRTWSGLQSLVQKQLKEILDELV